METEVTTEKQKSMATIKNWSVYGKVLIGLCVDHYRKDLVGKSIHTSTVLKLDRENNLCETLNTIYKLENEVTK